MDDDGVSASVHVVSPVSKMKQLLTAIIRKVDANLNRKVDANLKNNN